MGDRSSPPGPTRKVLESGSEGLCDLAVLQGAVHRGRYLWPIGSESSSLAEPKHEGEAADREALLYPECGKVRGTASECRWHLPALTATDWCACGRKCRIKNLRIGGCRDGSAVKSTCCSSTGPSFVSQHPHEGSQPSITPSNFPGKFNVLF